MRYTLLVIDMQPHACFASTRNLEAMKRAIRLAMRDGNPIVFTELTHWGDTAYPSTHSVLREMVKGYPRVIFVDKSTSSAALHVKNFCEPKIETEKFVMGGCNTDGCILSTALGSKTPDGTTSAYGLVDLYPQAEIIVLKDCCDTISREKNDPFAGFAGHQAIRLVQTVEDFERDLSVAA
jgi:nicotinamidase-related amidase